MPVTTLTTTTFVVLDVRATLPTAAGASTGAGDQP